MNSGIISKNSTTKDMTYILSLFKKVVSKYQIKQFLMFSVGRNNNKNHKNICLVGNL